METSEDSARLASVPQRTIYPRLASSGKSRRCPFNGALKSGSRGHKTCEQAGCATGCADAASTLQPFPPFHPPPLHHPVTSHHATLEPLTTTTALEHFALAQGTHHPQIPRRWSVWTPARRSLQSWCGEHDTGGGSDKLSGPLGFYSRETDRQSFDSASHAAAHWRKPQRRRMHNQ